jgi:hypothetical protein
MGRGYLLQWISCVMRAECFDILHKVMSEGKRHDSLGGANRGNNKARARHGVWTQWHVGPIEEIAKFWLGVGRSRRGRNILEGQSTTQSILAPFPSTCQPCEASSHAIVSTFRYLEFELFASFP